MAIAWLKSFRDHFLGSVVGKTVVVAAVTVVVVVVAAAVAALFVLVALVLWRLLLEAVWVELVDLVSVHQEQKHRHSLESTFESQLVAKMMRFHSWHSHISFPNE